MCQIIGEVDMDVVVVEVKVEETSKIGNDPKKSRMMKDVGVELLKITESLGVVGCFHTFAPHSQALQE